LSNILIVIDRHYDPIAFLLALNLYFCEDNRMVDLYFLLDFENNLRRVMSSLIDDFS